MLAAQRISKLQKEKRPQSAGRPKSASGSRPKSAGSTRPTLARNSRPKSAPGNRPTSLIDTEPISEHLKSRPSSATSGKIFIQEENDPGEQKYQIHSSIENDQIQEWAGVHYSGDSDDVCAESFPETAKSVTAIFSASSGHSSLESSFNQKSTSVVTKQRPASVSTSRYKRPASGTRRKSQSAGRTRPKSASGQRRGSNSKRPARRMENKYARRVYKEEVKQARKPDLQGSCKAKAKALWVAFVMSFLPKIITTVGLIICMLGIIMIGIGSNAEANYPDGKAVGAVMFVLGLVSVVIGLIALKVRRIAKKKMRGLASEQAREKYAMNGISNGNISIISNDINLDADFPRRQKSSFTVIENEESGFTNLAAVIYDYHLPGSPYRKKRRESIEATMKQMDSPRRSEEPEVLVVPTPTSGNKSRGGKNVKKSKGNKENGGLPKKPTLDDIPEVVITADSPRDPHVTDRSPRPSPKPVRKDLKDCKTSPAPSPTISRKFISSPKSNREDTNSDTPSPVLSHRSFKGKEDVSDSPVPVQKSPRNSSPDPTHNNPPPISHDNSDSWDDTEDDLGINQNRENEQKEAQTNNVKAAYKNMGFDDGDIVPEDLN